jgi:HSP20 family molecular chaperone IbpA
MDLHEDSAKFVISTTFELPSVNKENIQVELNEGLLTSRLKRILEMSECLFGNIDLASSSGH